MFSRISALRSSKQLVVLALWLGFVGWSLWQHAHLSQQPPIYDAFSYYQKAYNFWSEIRQHHRLIPFSAEPTFRPPGTILMSYPFGFDVDYRNFYFRSVFLPIALIALAVAIAGYRRELDSKGKWQLVLIAIFLTTLPCFYQFEPAPGIPVTEHWGLVDNFLAGVAAFAAAAIVRGLRMQSLAWVALAALSASFCMLIKPAGMLVMMLIGLSWFCLSAIKLKLVWHLPDERKIITRGFLRGMIAFAIPYLIVAGRSFTSHYLSSENLAWGNAAIVVMRTELLPSWPVLKEQLSLGIGFPIAVWLCLMIVLVGSYLWRVRSDRLSFGETSLTGLALASFATFAFGIWFWIFGSGGTTQIRYVIPFMLMTAILALPAIQSMVGAMSGWKSAILSIFMIAPAINIGLLLPQANAPIPWQLRTGVNLTSGASDASLVQARDFVAQLKREGSKSIVLYSISMNLADEYFSAVIEYMGVKSPPQIGSMNRPIDWQRPSVYRKKEMLAADYWLFEPARDSHAAHDLLAAPSIDTFEQERVLFGAWATQLTTNDGVAVVSDTPQARVLRIFDPILLEHAFDALVAKHHWRDTFVAENPRSQFGEAEVTATLALNQASVENVKFADRFRLRALSASRKGDDTIVRFWWNPLAPLPESDWSLFIHSIDDEGKIVIATGVPVQFSRPLSSLDGVVLFDQITFSNPTANGTHRLAIGFVRSNQAALVADSGTRDWDNRRVIIPLPNGDLGTRAISSIESPGRKLPK